MSDQARETFIAVRPRRAVEAGAAELSGRADAAALGALRACRWALDPSRPAPVTGRAVTLPLAELDLAVEERAAIDAARDPGLAPPDRARARGTARALGWILGFDPLHA
ncbi:hypothetical protein ACFC58_13510 [Kitasatospora purpeofusca]|uniref:hypothetical protein n=1 Tax=Kitasatospora purpeofusca TaxID=67352 RepID=UPI0035DBBC07